LRVEGRERGRSVRAQVGENGRWIALGVIADDAGIRAVEDVAVARGIAECVGGLEVVVGESAPAPAQRAIEREILDRVIGRSGDDPRRADSESGARRRDFEPGVGELTHEVPRQIVGGDLSADTAT